MPPGSGEGFLRLSGGWAGSLGIRHQLSLPKVGGLQASESGTSRFLIPSPGTENPTPLSPLVLTRDRTTLVRSWPSLHRTLSLNLSFRKRKI